MLRAYAVAVISLAGVDRAGTVPEWIGAIGTVGAVAVALWFAMRDRRERAHDRGFENAKALKLEVQAWNDGGYNSTTEFSAMADNQGDHSFVDVVIWVADPRLPSVTMRRVGPGRRQFAKLATLPTADKVDMSFEARYSDHKGRRWFRDRNGELFRLRRWARRSRRRAPDHAVEAQPER